MRCVLDRSCINHQIETTTGYEHRDRCRDGVFLWRQQDIAHLRWHIQKGDALGQILLLWGDPEAMPNFEPVLKLEQLILDWVTATTEKAIIFKERPGLENPPYPDLLVILSPESCSDELKNSQPAPHQRIRSWRATTRSRHVNRLLCPLSLLPSWARASLTLCLGFPSGMLPVDFQSCFIFSCSQALLVYGGRELTLLKKLNFWWSDSENGKINGNLKIPSQL
jgi:hypothetical protein